MVSIILKLDNLFDGSYSYTNVYGISLHIIFTDMKNFVKLLLIVFLISSCVTNREEVEPMDFMKIDLSKLPVEEIVITDSDYDLKPEFSHDRHTSLKVHYTENYQFDPEQNDKFAIASKIFDARIGGGLTNSMVNGLTMCNNPLIDCNFNERQPNGTWRTAGRREASGDFEWKFINLKATKIFNVKVKNLPGQTTIIDYDTLFSNKKDNRIVIRKNTETDSVLVQLISFPKEMLNGRISNWTWSAISYPGEVEGDTWIIKKGNLLSRSIPTNDTVFLNVATIKRFINIIDNEDVGFTYQFNNIVPLQMDKDQ